MQLVCVCMCVCVCVCVCVCAHERLLAVHTSHNSMLPDFPFRVSGWRLLLKRQPECREIAVDSDAEPVNRMPQAQVQCNVLTLV